MNLNKKIQKNNRNSNIELLRILCIINIILHHSFYHSDFSNVTLQNFNYLILYLIEVLGTISNDIFILITGYYVVNSKVKLRNIIKLVLESIFYSYAIMIIYTIINQI